MAQSLVNDAEQSGSFPRWALANAATAEMTGDSVVPLIVNLYAFGAKDFDVKAALRYMVNAATVGGVGRNGMWSGRESPLTWQHGYLPQTTPFCGAGSLPSASITLEWSVDDFAISRFADALGDSRDRGQNSRTGPSIGRTCSIPAPGTSRPAMPSVSSPTAPGCVRPASGLLQSGRIRRGQRRAIPLVGARRISPAW